MSDIQSLMKLSQDHDELKDMGEYIKFTIESGLISISGQPLKCGVCGSSNLENTKPFYEGYTLCEYTCVCSECGHIAGHWSYGNWEW